jgi:hypothetical protein
MREPMTVEAEQAERDERREKRFSQLGSTTPPEPPRRVSDVERLELKLARAELARFEAEVRAQQNGATLAMLNAQAAHQKGLALQRTLAARYCIGDGEGVDVETGEIVSA